MPAIAALHPLNGFLVPLIATWLARDAWRVRQPNVKRSVVAFIAEEPVTH